jgi:hypothetical protein
MKYADLHVHTFYSDSTFSPEEVISCADEKGLAAVAICDHDCIDGIAPCAEFARRSERDVEVIPGIEMTAEKEDAEIHILGYFIDWADTWLHGKLKALQDARVIRMLKMIERLKEHGIEIDPRDVLKLSGRGSVGRLHLASAMLKSKKIKVVDEAFAKYIGSRKPCYVTNVRFTPREAIELIMRVRGVPVLAHPFTLNRDDFIPEFIKDGLKGIEVYHSDHNTALTRHYEDLAKRHGLIITGGSDCHGLGKGKVLMGGVRVPYSVVEQLREESRKGA